MPSLVRLPAHVPAGEIRVYWDATDEATGLHVWGPRGVTWGVLDHFTRPRPGSARDGDRSTSLVQWLENLGYDPKTLVL